ncbi:MAG: glycosyltransferase [Bauldia sp.]|nr:glycosyltransferase [Bauldia sp.]
MAKASIRDASGRIVQFEADDLSARRFVRGGTRHRPEEFLIAFPATADAAQATLTLEPWLADERPSLLDEPAISLTPSRRLALPVTESRPLTITATIASDRPSLSKEFVCRIVYSDESGEPIPPPYPGLFTMKLGKAGYFHVSGEPVDNRLRLERRVLPPPGARHMEIELTRWKTRAHPICLGLSVLETSLLPGVHTAPAEAPAVIEPVSWTPHPARARSIKCLDFLGPEAALRPDAPRDAWIDVDHEACAVELDISNAADVQIALRVTSETPAAGVEVTAAFRDRSGQAPPDQPTLIETRRWPVLSACRFFPPAGATGVSIRIRATGTADGNVRISNILRVATQRLGLSVVVAVYKAEELLPELLKALASQTLPHDRFEVIFVINGEPDGSERVIRKWHDAHRTIDAKIVHEDIASPGNARNRGAVEARFSHITFVDCDDTVSPGFLAGLFDALGEDIIAVADVVDITPEGEQLPDNAISEEIRMVRTLGAVPSLDTLRATSALSACKAIPTFYCRATPWLPSLRSGEDIAFHCGIYAKFEPVFRLADPQFGSVYRRWLRPGSLSRRPADFHFSVEERLDVIEALAGIRPRSTNARVRSFIDGKMEAQSDFISRFLHDHPERFADYANDVRKRDLTDFPEARIKQRSAARIVFAYCFPPFVDASAVTAAKRLVDYGAPCDVVSNQMRGVRASDPRMLSLIANVVARHTVLETPPSFSDGDAVAAYADLAVQTAEDFADRRQMPYASIYSRALWSASHYAGALFKLRYPDTAWEAEFSDPILKDTSGSDRIGDLPERWLDSRGFVDALRDRGLSLPFADRNLFYWCEVLAYAFADRLIFTNDSQLAYMLSYCPPALRGMVQEKSVVRPHPIVPAWAGRRRSTPGLRINGLNLAYFGSFYPARGFGRVFEALRDLDQTEREQLRLFIFTKNTDETAVEVQHAGLGDVVRVRPELPYVDFLEAMKDFDALIVNDVDNSVIGNPYLPSKLSDYASSGVPILALFQPGSELSRRPEPSFRCSLARPDFSTAFREVLKEMIASRDAPARKP